MTVQSRTWLITGVSSGFGRAIAVALLARGDHVAGTIRQPDQASSFEALAKGRAHAVRLDVNDRARIAPAITEAVQKLGGRLDVLVNNAGYGLMGALEEVDEDQIDSVISTNLLGTIFVTRAALPALRESKGVIANFSSLAGLLGIPGVSAYCAAKFGVEGFTEALRAEVGHFGVRTVLIEPGAFRTNFSGGSVALPRSPLRMYDGTPGGQSRSLVMDYSGHEPGDPAKAAKIIIDVLGRAEPPFRLLLGSDVLEGLGGKIESMQEEMAAVCDIAPLTDFARPTEA